MAKLFKNPDQNQFSEHSEEEQTISSHTVLIDIIATAMRRELIVNEALFVR